MRAELLDLCGDADGAEELRELSLETALEVEINCYAYQLLWRDLVEKALELMRTNVARHPDSWNAWDSLGEAYEANGDMTRAIDAYLHASRLTEHQGHRQRIKRHVQELTALGKVS
jgi:predicted Zn-dependent protease